MLVQIPGWSFTHCQLPISAWLIFNYTSYVGSVSSICSLKIWRALLTRDVCVCVCVCIYIYIYIYISIWKSCGGDVNKAMIISDCDNIHRNYYLLWKCLHCMFLHLHPVTYLIRPISSHRNFCVVYYKPFPIWKWRELVWLGWYAYTLSHTHTHTEYIIHCKFQGSKIQCNWW